METKTEQRSVSGEASALTETVKSNEAMKASPERSSKSSSAEEKTQSRRSPRPSGRKKSTATTEKALEAIPASISDTAEKPAIENERPIEEPVSSEKESAPAEDKKKPTSRRSSKSSAKSVKDEPAAKVKASEKTEKPAEEKTEMKQPDAPEKAETESPQKTPAKKATTKAKKPEKTEKIEKVEAVSEPVKEPEDTISPAIAESAESGEQTPVKKPARTTKKAASTTEKEAQKTEKSSKKSKTETKKSAEKPTKAETETPAEKAAKEEPKKATKSPSAPSIEEKLEAMAKKAKQAKTPEAADVAVEQLTAEIPAEVPAEILTDEPSVTELPKENEISETATEMASEVVKAENNTEGSAVLASPFVQSTTAEAVDVSGTPHDTFVFYSPSQLAAIEADAELKKAAEAEPVMEIDEDPKLNGVIEVTEPEATVVIPAKTHPERRPAQRRSDPHEREVMDKELVRTNLFSVLGSAAELERRALIEETMKAIPLTDEERKDNHPTSLSNRVRSVIGSVLAEELVRGTVVAAGRKLTLPKKEETAEEAHDLIENSSEEAVQSDAVGPEATLEIEIEFDSNVEAEEKQEEPSVSADEDAEDEPFEDAEPVRTPVASALPVDAIAAPAPVAMRETSIRRTRQSRTERRSSQAQGASAVLITEEELERVMLNALRRNSATKADLLAVLKRTYVDPNRFSREEENRLYAVAGNVLQKLVNRGTLQNNDGRYLQKPSQRVLNPGRAPGASFTGNVETRFITELNRQSGDFFEQFAARLLEKYFEMSNIRVDASYVVGGSDDNGIDIMLETTDWLGYKERVFVQAKKRATQPVTLKEVREFYGALCAEEGTRGVFITTSSFCMEASKMIGKIRNLIAIDKRKLFALAEHCEVGLVRDEEGRLLLDENLFLDYDV